MPCFSIETWICPNNDITSTSIIHEHAGWGDLWTVNNSNNNNNLLKFAAVWTLSIVNPNLSAAYSFGWMLECGVMNSKYFALSSDAKPFQIVPCHTRECSQKMQSNTMQTMPMTRYIPACWFHCLHVHGFIQHGILHDHLGHVVPSPVLMPCCPVLARRKRRAFAQARCARCTGETSLAWAETQLGSDGCDIKTMIYQ